MMQVNNRCYSEIRRIFLKLECLSMIFQNRKKPQKKLFMKISTANKNSNMFLNQYFLKEKKPTQNIQKQQYQFVINFIDHEIVTT